MHIHSPPTAKKKLREAHEGEEEEGEAAACNKIYKDPWDSVSSNNRNQSSAASDRVAPYLVAQSQCRELFPYTMTTVNYTEDRPSTKEIGAMYSNYVWNVN